MRRRPRDELVGRPSVDHALNGDVGDHCVLTSAAEPFELARCVGVRVNGEGAAEPDRLMEQVLGGILPFGPGVDLDGRAGARAGGEDRVGVERRLGSAASDDDAPGASAYRAQVRQALSNYTIESIPHERVIAQIDETSKQFHVLVLKTTMTIPYSSVFIRLDCKYWSADAEKRMRARMH